MSQYYLFLPSLLGRIWVPSKATQTRKGNKGSPHCDILLFPISYFIFIYVFVFVMYCFSLFRLYMFLYFWHFTFFVFPISHLYSFYILLSVISYFVFYIFLIRPSIFIVQSLQLLIEPRASMIIGKGFAQLISAKIGTNHLRGVFFIICICNFLYLYLYFCIWNRIC